MGGNGSGSSDGLDIMNDMERSRWERLLRWLSEEHGMDVGEGAFHVEAKEVEGAGRGLFACRDCKPSTTLFKVPSTALMNKKTLANVYPQLRGQSVSAVQLVSLHLLLHRPLGNSDSRDPAFGPYISTLPRDFSSHPLSWLVKRQLQRVGALETRLLDLVPPSSYRKLSKLHKRFWSDWEVIRDIMVKHPGLMTTCSRTDLTSVSLQAEDDQLVMDYLWAWLNVNTRCIFYRIRPTLSDPDNFTLCPVLDFANHRPGDTHIFPVVDSEVWSTVTNKPSKYFLFISSSKHSLSCGQELYLQYGSHPNSFLFSEYGFVNDAPEEAIATGAYCGEVDVQEYVEQLVAEKSTLGQRLKSILETEGYWGDWTMHGGPQPAHPSYRLISALRLISAVGDISSDEDTTFEAAVNQWHNVIYGLTGEMVSPIEQRWRSILSKMCAQIAARARTKVEILWGDSDRGGEVGWEAWMLRNVQVLWREEMEVAEAVSASLSANIEF